MCLVPLFSWARGIVTAAIFGHLEAFWNKNYLTKCVQNLILYKIKVLKLSQNASKWPKMAELTIPRAQIKSGTKHIVYHLESSLEAIRPLFKSEATRGRSSDLEPPRGQIWHPEVWASDLSIIYHSPIPLWNSHIAQVHSPTFLQSCHRFSQQS